VDTTRFTAWTLDGSDIGRHGTSILDRLGTTQAPPPTWLVLATAGVALLAVLHRPVWRVARNVVTIAHEGGHALTALLVGRRLDNIRLHSDTSGVTVSSGKPYGPGMVFTMMAGYPAPALLGLGFAALLGGHRVTLMLWLAIALLAALLLKIRNAYGVFSVLVTGAATFAVSWFGSASLQAGFAYLGTWFLLFAGVRPVFELRRSRRRQPGSDADQLAGLTGIPAAAWVLLFGLATLAALVVGGRLLVAGIALDTWQQASGL
jgi:hypothetical protein